MIKKGKLIVFIGIDGSGKTSQSKRLLNYLLEKKKKAVIVRPFFLLSGSLVHHRPKPDFSLKTGNGKSRKVFFPKLVPIFLLADNWLNYLINIYRLLFKYDYLISDRYFYDYYPSLTELSYGSSRMNNLYGRLLPKPDKTFLFDLSPEVAIRRKMEQPIALLARNRGRYLSLAEKLPFIIKIDANVSEEKLFSKLADSFD